MTHALLMAAVLICGDPPAAAPADSPATGNFVDIPALVDQAERGYLVQRYDRAIEKYEQVVAAIDEELQKLAQEPPSAEELAKVTARWASTMHKEHDRLTNRTLGLGSAELLFGRAELIYELPRRIASVTVDEVSAAAKALRPDARALLLVNPTGGAQ